MATHFTTDSGRTWDYITINDALIRASFHLFDLDREDVSDALMDALEDITIRNAPDHTNERMVLAFAIRIHAIAANDAIDIVCKELDRRGLGDISASLIQFKDL